MKNIIIIFILVLTGCGSVDANRTNPVNGAWQGIIYESESWKNTVNLRINNETVVGGHVLTHIPTESNSYASLTGVIVGDEDGFSMVVNIGGNINNNWAYTGYVQDGSLCLIRDVLPEPVRCLAPTK